MSDYLLGRGKNSGKAITAEHGTHPAAVVVAAAAVALGNELELMSAAVAAPLRLRQLAASSVAHLPHRKLLQFLLDNGP